MLTFYLLVTLVIFLTLILLIVLIGDLPNYRGTILHRSHIILVDEIFNEFAKKFEIIDKNYLNGFFTSKQSKRRIRWISGWIIPVFYLAVFTKFLQFFFTLTFPQILKLEKLSKTGFDWSIRLNFVIIPAIAINYLSFLLAVLSDPGYIDTKKPYDRTQYVKLLEEFPFDGLLFFKDKSCSTCKVIKPARSKHCGSCDRCILMFDHHCIWLNNDVAYYTFRWFFIFLCSVCFVFIYGAYLSYYSLMMYIKLEKLPKIVETSSGVTKYWRLIKNSTFTNEISGIMFLLCILLFPLVGFFLGETIWSVYLGVTTNETAKWDHIHNFMEFKVLYQFLPNDNSPSTFLLLKEKTADGKPLFITINDRLPFNTTAAGNLKGINDWDDLANIYDKGFWSNLEQKLFPKKFN
ncbi:palmitoyltransferase [Pichia kluyveri]|uniref:Palmitoyltransferase n=1 Tax=Pichia kluyveri TaxID=36015 RepID=A0AAV5QYD4_PICKL|nr:palmitoyltransferase [Pichia kluyveri]